MIINLFDAYFVLLLSVLMGFAQTNRLHLVVISVHCYGERYVYYCHSDFKEVFIDLDVII